MPGQTQELNVGKNDRWNGGLFLVFAPPPAPSVFRDGDASLRIRQSCSRAYSASGRREFGFLLERVLGTDDHHHHHDRHDDHHHDGDGTDVITIQASSPRDHAAAAPIRISSPSALTTFEIVEKLGFPSSESAL